MFLIFLIFPFIPTLLRIKMTFLHSLGMKLILVYFNIKIATLWDPGLSCFVRYWVLLYPSILPSLERKQSTLSQNVPVWHGDCLELKTTEIQQTHVKCLLFP